MEKIKDKITAKKTLKHESVLEQLNIETFCTFMYQFLEDLSKVWLTGTLEQQQILLSSIFSEDLVWDNNAYRTTGIKQNFLPIQANRGKDNAFVPLGGVNGTRTRDLFRDREAL